MNKLLDLYAAFDDLWKGRKPMTADQLGELAGRMDESLGPWPEGHGSRKEAVQHFVRMGRAGALSQKGAAPGTPEGMAYQFAIDQTRHARANVTKKAPVLPTSDTLTGAIDKEHIDHYATHWANHFDIVDHAPRRQREVDGDLLPVLPHDKQANPFQVRSRTAGNRIKLMAAQSQPHIATMDDLDTIHTGVERAIQAGKVSEGDANRYHVMRAAMKQVHKGHGDSHPGLPFEPSYASMDTTAVRVMQAGVEHLDESGFREAKGRLAPMLASAVDAHAKVPFRPTKDVWGTRAVATPYPNLHPMGSKAHEKQLTAITTHLNRVGKHRRRPETRQFEAEQKAAVAKPEAADEGPKLPANWEEYTQLRDAGRITDPRVHIAMERKRREERAAKNVAKAFAAACLVKSLKQWRGES